MEFAIFQPRNLHSVELLASMLQNQSILAALSLTPNQSSLPSSLPPDIVKASTCYYSLSLNTLKLPKKPSTGWTVGSSIPNQDPEVDFVLAPPQFLGKETGIMPFQLVFEFHKDSGAFTFAPIQSSVEVFADGDFVYIPPTQRRLIFERRTLFRFGRAEWELTFTITAEHLPDFLIKQSFLLRQLESNLQQTPIHFLPFCNSFRSNQVIVANETLATGGYGHVHEAISITGEALAVKSLFTKSRNHYISYGEEYRIATLFSGAESITRVKGFWCEHETDLTIFSCQKCSDMNWRAGLFISFPLAQGSFSDLFEEELIDFPDRLTLYHQSLSAINVLRQRNIIHRDISVRNILIITYFPPRASITDFGKAVKYVGHPYFETALGPKATVAPEVWRKGGYSFSVDLFSWAFAIASLHIHPPWWPDGKVTESSLKEYRDAILLKGSSQPDFGLLSGLLCMILRWEVGERISIDAAISHPCWTKLNSDREEE